MNYPFKTKVNSKSETINIAHDFCDYLNPGDTVALNGELGSGKTFFVKAIGSKLKATNVSSPSFAIVNVYEGRYKINHFDFYRIKEIEELYDIGFHEYLSDNDSVTFIEWAEMFPELLPKKHFEVKIELNANSEREIIINKHE